MEQTTVQYVQAGITVILGLVSIFLPLKYNPFQFKKYGLGRTISTFIPEKIQQKIPKVIGYLLVFTGFVVAVLTTFLGAMPW